MIYAFHSALHQPNNEEKNCRKIVEKSPFQIGLQPRIMQKHSNNVATRCHHLQICLNQLVSYLSTPLVQLRFHLNCMENQQNSVDLSSGKSTNLMVMLIDIFDWIFHSNKVFKWLVPRQRNILSKQQQMKLPSMTKTKTKPKKGVRCESLGLFRLRAHWTQLSINTKLKWKHNFTSTHASVWIYHFCHDFSVKYLSHAWCRKRTAFVSIHKQWHLLWWQ